MLFELEGYFSSNIYEYFLHHSLPITAYAYMYFMDTFIGFGICCLLIEINSIFLHTRTLLKDHQIRLYPLDLALAWLDLSSLFIYRHYNCIWGICTLFYQLTSHQEIFLLFCFISLVIIEGKIISKKKIKFLSKAMNVNLTKRWVNNFNKNGFSWTH